MNEIETRNERASWDDLSAFLAVARAGGLASAAKHISSSAPTLGRRMRALERALGRDLFVRRSHGYDLTNAGVELLQELEPLASQLDRITAPIKQEALPLVKVSAGTWTSLALAKCWREITGDPPDVRLRLVTSEAILNIGRREVAIAIRNQRPTETGLAGRKLARNEFAIYGVKDAPLTWIIPNVDTPSARWARARVGRDAFHEVTHPRLALDMALAGAGQVVLPTFIGDTEDKLGRRSDAIADLTHEAWLAVHDDDRNLPEIRRVLDRIHALRS